MRNDLLRYGARNLNDLFIFIYPLILKFWRVIRWFFRNLVLFLRIRTRLWRWIRGGFCQSWRRLFKFIFRFFFLNLVLINFARLEILTNGLSQWHLSVIVQVCLKLLLSMLDRSTVVRWKILRSLARSYIQIILTVFFATNLVEGCITATIGRTTNRWNTDILNTCTGSINLIANKSISSKRWCTPALSSAMTAVNVSTNTTWHDRAKRCWMGISWRYWSSAGKLIHISLSVSYFSLLFEQVFFKFLLGKFFKWSFILHKICSHLPLKHFLPLFIEYSKLSLLIQKLK